MGIVDRLQLLLRSEMRRPQSEPDVRSTLREAKTELNRLLDDESRLEAQIDKLRSEADRWEEVATGRLRKGDEAGAKEALRSREAILMRQRKLSAELVEHRALASSLMDLTDRVRSGGPASGSQTQPTHERRHPDARDGRSAGPGPRSADTARLGPPTHQNRTLPRTTRASDLDLETRASGGAIGELSDALDHFDSYIERTESDPTIRTKVLADEVDTELFGQTNERARSVVTGDYDERLDVESPLFDQRASDMEARFRELEEAHKLKSLKEKMDK